ncbi:MAG TPA: twin-arginine translocation signal domain-containing protein, partial [Desulfopila sp.]|nr:twin-arginine translocation signal domain-containing protein [Desulfopila sp.]
MKVEISRRKFLQGSVALTVLGGTSLSGADILAKSAEKERLSGSRTVPTVCEMCVNKCAAL